MISDPARHDATDTHEEAGQASNPTPQRATVSGVLDSGLTDELHGLLGRDDRVQVWLSLLVAWIGRAHTLLSPDNIYVHGAHNKIKHGMAARARDDLRLTFTTREPDIDGSVPLSALKPPNGFDVFAGPVLEYVYVPPKTGPGVPAHGLEFAQLNIGAERTSATSRSPRTSEAGRQSGHATDSAQLTLESRRRPLHHTTRPAVHTLACERCATPVSCPKPATSSRGRRHHRTAARPRARRPRRAGGPAAPA